MRSKFNFPRTPFLLIILSFFCATQLIAQDQILVKSPDQKISISFSLQKLSVYNYGGNSPDAPYYKVDYEDQALILPSRLGLMIGGEPELSSCFNVINHRIIHRESTWKPIYGERNSNPDNYNELILSLEEYIPPHRQLNIHFRAYNEGIAIRYSFPSIKKNEILNVVDEFTEYKFPEKSEVWVEYGQSSQGTYSRQPISNLKPNCELPLLTKAGTNFLCIAETANDNYPRSFVRPVANGAKMQLRGEANIRKGEHSPWRVVLIGKSAGALTEHNYLLLNLNEPNQIADCSWIKPEKIVRDITLSAKGAKACIDYAADHGLDGIIFDAGWYGPVNNDTSDARHINVVGSMSGLPIKDHTGLSVKEVIEYGKTRKIDIWLYVNYQALERQADELLPLYKSWGVVGIKPGFVRVGNQQWQKWLHDIVRKAAKYQLMVDPHDQYRPSGFSRTYPNLMSQEGIRGNEQNPDADQTTMLPFTRFVIGAGDYTPGYCKQALPTTFAHRLALPVLYYSPAQFLFWSEDVTGDCHLSPELELWKTIPTVWDDTKFIGGEPGEFAIIARRSGNVWYLGAITNKSAREIEIPLSFLGNGTNITARIYTDGGEEVKTVTRVKIEDRELSGKDILKFSLKPSGGMAAKLTLK